LKFIDLSSQQKKIRPSLDKRFKNIMDHGKYIMGPEVFEVEEKLADYVGVKHCISCSSGTDALLIPLLARGIGIGDAIITTPFTYIATAEVIALLGATPIFCDIYPKTFNIDPSALDKAYNEALSKGLKPKVIIPVDLFGLPARYRLIKQFAKDKNLFVLEDAAQGFGGSINGKKAGSFGDVAATSFFPAKPLGCYGDGGAIFTNDDELAIKMQSIRVHGSGQDKYDNVRIGINGRLDTFQAAVILEKLKIFEDEIHSRNKIAEVYSRKLTRKVIKPHIPTNYISSWAQYSIICDNKSMRDMIIKSLSYNKIPSMIYYRIPLHLQKVFKYLKYNINDFPISENISNKILSLPMHPYLTKTDQNRIIETLNSIFK
jgi:UDP-2-acetamido-2-deoxy-ribo-hexuluronate aminotransferase